MIDVKIIFMIIFFLWGLDNWHNRTDTENQFKLEKAKADSLENVVHVNDSIIMNLKSEYLIAMKQVHKDSVNVENFKKNRPKKFKGLNREEINKKFSDYFNARRSK